MQIKFLTLYHVFDDIETSKAIAQEALLCDWQRAIQTNNIKNISKAHISFNDYSFFEYPDQEKSKKYIQKSYGLYDRQTEPFQYFWSGKYYSDLDTLYNALAEQKKFMELVITVEDY